ncbi:phosphatidylserine/phosphatidylglycerophosphate/cardiolipin synthase-like enzyme [Kibdelosporangium banguiense]|uniref:Phosphatidylserine/phosphatidylglycerophosphate/ cardiolipin synthase-like enzyme n=1 Tax=Kibdelosporangium banguiense TaxID=1365924 RepID=A0ABS4TNB3_9PSEU|nr:phospholipase D-like domain-containing protein [Kibdelosporangium banguiense]MBP2325859.1 phosphatidylserine/phosphatidylglycerophosphate/cardiolipin synthase-like enzyme [Kibdelosporangium banguiense]
MGLLDRIDDWLGDGLERLLCSHHAHRLRKLGWGEVLDEPAHGWFSPHAPIRHGCRLEVLIDGEQALPAMVAAIQGARSHVYIAGWHSSPDFKPTREPGAQPLRDLLAEVSQRVPVRVLLWAGPPVPAFQPTRARARKACEEFMRDSQVRCVLDSRERTLHCHHEKLVIVDDEVAFVGGMDFTAMEGDRHDSPQHPADRPIGWHDLTTKAHGPVVADVTRHFVRRWREVAGEDLPKVKTPGPAGDHTVQFVRTVPERTYEFAPSGEFTVLDTYMRALRSAERLVYLENQFLWSPEITEVLIGKLREPPDDRFRLVLVLPRKPSNGADTTRGQLGRLVDADDGAGRLLAVTLTSHDGDNAVPVYVHAKLGIVDDKWMTIGSANLNEHSLFNDTEANLVVTDAALIKQTRLRLWAEHLQRSVSEVDDEPDKVIDQLWRPLAEGAQPHRIALLPGVSRRAERLEGPLRGLLVDG